MKTIFTTPFNWLLIYVLVNLIIGIFIVSDFGISSDEFIDRLRSSAALKAYNFSGELDLEDSYLSLPSTIRFYGTAQGMLFEAAEQKLTPILGTTPGTVRHFGYFVSFQVAIVSIYFLSRIFTSAWISLAVSLIFGTQPLLFGHAFINPKDIPLLAIFTAVVAAGFNLSKKFQSYAPLHVLKYSYIDWSRARVEINKQFSPLVLSGLGIIAGLLVGVRLLNNQIATRLARMPGNYFWWRILPPVGSDNNIVGIDAQIQQLSLLISQWVDIVAAVFFIGLVVFLMIFLRKKDLIVETDATPIFRQIEATSGRFPISFYLAILGAGALWGVAISTRVIGIVAGGIVGICLLVEFRKKAILPLVLYTISAGLICYLTWPFLWAFGFSGLVDSLDTLLRFPSWDGIILFGGVFYPAKTLPPYYMTKLIAMQLSLPVVILSVIGGMISLAALKDKPESRVKVLLLFAWFSLPVLITALANTVQYDNFRQFLFILPPLFVFLGIFLDWLEENVQGRWITIAVIVVSILPAIGSIVKLHPYQYIYYNPLVGGVEGAYRDYNLDYWMISYKNAAEWIDENLPPGSRILIWDWSGELRFRNYVKNDFELINGFYTAPEERVHIDYILVTTELHLDDEYRSVDDPIFTVERDNAPLVLVFKSNP